MNQEAKAMGQAHKRQPRCTTTSIFLTEAAHLFIKFILFLEVQPQPLRYNCYMGPKPKMPSNRFTVSNQQGATFVKRMESLSGTSHQQYCTVACMHASCQHRQVYSCARILNEILNRTLRLYLMPLFKFTLCDGGQH